MRNELKCILSLLIAIQPSSNIVFAQNDVKHYNDAFYTADYSVTNGMLNGKYVSYYKNGHKKAEGKFQFNNRVGKWDVYDSTGQLKIERVYANAYEFTQAVPAIPGDSAKLLSAPLYIPTRNAYGFYKYYELQQKQIMWKKRTWAYIFDKDNYELGDSNGFFKIIYKQMLAHNIKGYKFSNIDWDHSFFDSVDFSKTPLDTSQINIIGYLIKQDWFYNADMGIMDNRILGICPLAIRKGSLPFDSVNKEYFNVNAEGGSEDTLMLFWIYYPQARRYLAKENVSEIDAPSVKNLDDVFFWKYYNESIISEVSASNVSQVSDNWATRLMMIDWEHDIWMGWTEYN